MVQIEGYSTLRTTDDKDIDYSLDIYSRPFYLCFSSAKSRSIFYEISRALLRVTSIFYLSIFDFFSNIFYFYSNAF